MKSFAFIIVFLVLVSLSANDQIARLHYNGGGDWYNDQDAIPNLCKFLNENIHTNFKIEEAIVKAKKQNLFDYPFIFLTGHGKISFDEQERNNLREYFDRGGFLYADDDYGMDSSFRNEMRKIFPDKELIELPVNHDIFSSFYKFENGLPKIHKHEDKRPQAFAIFSEDGRMLVLYTYESNISDGWSNAHDDNPTLRNQAFKMGANIIYYLITK